MTSPDNDTPTTPSWASPTGGQPLAPQDSPPPVAPPQGPPRAPGYPASPGYSNPPGYPSQPGYANPPGYGYQPGYGPQPGYRPPAAQPGIIPLRPLGLGEILDGAFRAIRANPRVMFGLTALVVTVTVAIQTVLQWYIGGLLGSAVTDVSSNLDPTGEMAIADTLGPAIAQLLTLPALSVATTVLTGLLIVAVSRSVLGQTVTIGEVWRNYRGRVGQVLLFTIMITVGSTLAIGVVVAGIIFAAANGSTAGAVVIGLFGALGLVVGSVWILVRTLLVPPALMLEGAGFASAIRRGWTLSRGSFWRLLGIYLLTSIIVGVANALIVAPAGLISRFVFNDPLGTTFGSLVLSGIGSTIALTLTTVFSAAVVALLYVDVRMRREGLDMELVRASEAPPA